MIKQKTKQTKTETLKNKTTTTTTTTTTKPQKTTTNREKNQNQTKPNQTNHCFVTSPPPDLHFIATCPSVSLLLKLVDAFLYPLGVCHVSSCFPFQGASVD